ncbi:hypothetical protein G8G17_003443 [Vibrio cholerae]|nr:hypothetical protein [Vibrio cholerae]
MSRNTDYIYDLSNGWQPITAEIEKLLEVTSFEADHNKAIENAGYIENQFEKVELPSFYIQVYRSNYGKKYPYLLQISNDSDVSIVLIENFISFEKCISELVETRRRFIDCISS